MNVLLSLPAVTIRYAFLYASSYAFRTGFTWPRSVIASSLTLFAFDEYNWKDQAGRRSGIGSRPSDLVSAPLLGNLTTHISMDMGCVCPHLSHMPVVWNI